MGDRDAGQADSQAAKWAVVLDLVGIQSERRQCTSKTARQASDSVLDTGNRHGPQRLASRSIISVAHNLPTSICVYDVDGRRLRSRKPRPRLSEMGRDPCRLASI